MHRTLVRPRALLLGGLLIALIISGRPGALRAEPPGAPGNALIALAVGESTPLQMSTLKAIDAKKTKNSDPRVLGVQPVEGDPTQAILTGLAAGRAHLDLTDVAGRTESFDVAVGPRQTVTVPLSGTITLQMNTKKPISHVWNGNEHVLQVSDFPGDPSSLRLTGLQPGSARLHVFDNAGNVDVYDVAVRVDVAYLKAQLRQGLPTSNIEPADVGGSVILHGTVNHIEDVAVAVATAERAIGVPGVQIVPDLRVAGEQQMQLCVTVAEVSRSQFRSMAFDFLTNSKNTYLASTVGQAVVEPPTAGFAGPLSPSLFNQTLLGIPGLPNGNPTNVLFGVVHSRWAFLGFLQALRAENVVKTLNEPTVTTMSGRPASFLVGGEQAIPVPAGLGQVGVQFEEFGTRLNVVPIVLGNGKIRLEVEPEVSALNAANGTSINGTVVPGRTTSRVNTTVELEDGQMFVIGGVVQREVTGTTLKTPILGDLPFIGTAFSSKSYQEDETEMVMLVTPHLVDAEDCAQAPKMLPGDETRSPDDFELFLEGILEAPRGPREVFEDHHYVAAYKNGPTAALFPCAGRTGRNGSCPTCGADAVSALPAPALPTASAPSAMPATAEAPKAMPMLKPLNAPADTAKSAPPVLAPPAADDRVTPAASDSPAGDPAPPALPGPDDRR